MIHSKLAWDAKKTEIMVARTPEYNCSLSVSLVYFPYIMNICKMSVHITLFYKQFRSHKLGRHNNNNDIIIKRTTNGWIKWFIDKVRRGDEQQWAASVINGEIQLRFHCGGSCLWWFCWFRVCVCDSHINHMQGMRKMITMCGVCEISMRQKPLFEFDLIFSEILQYLSI